MAAAGQADAQRLDHPLLAADHRGVELGEHQDAHDAFARTDS